MLSELVKRFKQEQGSKFQPGKSGRRTMRSPTLPGQTRGAMGSTGARGFKGRNPDAGAEKERATMNSPMFQAFVEGMAPRTPVTDFLNGVL